MIYNVVKGNGDRTVVFDYINSKRTEGKYTVIDIGGTVEGWSAPLVDAIMDFNIPENGKYKDGLLVFVADITNPKHWKDVLEYVDKNGKFDFCICTHTLEDIMNPGFVCEQISKIAKEGYIATPSKHSELVIQDAYYVIPNKYRPESVLCYGHKYPHLVDNNSYEIPNLFPSSFEYSKIILH